MSIPIEDFEEIGIKQKEEQILADIMLPEKTKVPLPSTGKNIKEKPKYISIKRRPGLNVCVIARPLAIGKTGFLNIPNEFGLLRSPFLS